MLRENQTTEFKREYTDDIKKTVIAFANTDGGKLYVGIGDDRTVTGCPNTDELSLRISNAIRDAVKPDVTMFIGYTVETIDGKEVVIVDVQRGTARPYYLAGKGIRPEGVFVRQGASTVPASEAAILALIRETGGESYETTRSLNQELTFDNASAYFQKKEVAFGESQKRTLHLISSDGMFTNLALLLSEQCPYTIKMAVFQGGQKTSFKDRREFGGALFRQLDEVYEFIDRYNSLRSEFEGLDRIDHRDYPVAAIREALLNAIIHRDYGLSPSTLISIFDDRIEFLTIGGLVKGVSLNDILLGVSALRNPKLADVFYRLHLIEAYGTGMPKIFECYRGLSVQPKIELSDNAFKITLPNTQLLSVASASSPECSKRERQVLTLLADTVFITRKEVEQHLGISQATAITLLRGMTQKHFLETEGNGRNVKYRKA